MLILVEGADGSGKSYLINQLCEKGFAVQKVQWHQDFDFRQAAEHCWYGDINLVEDRSPITDIVYDWRDVTRIKRVYRTSRSLYSFLCCRGSCA